MRVKKKRERDRERGREKERRTGRRKGEGEYTNGSSVRMFSAHYSSRSCMLICRMPVIIMNTSFFFRRARDGTSPHTQRVRKQKHTHTRHPIDGRLCRRNTNKFKPFFSVFAPLINALSSIRFVSILFSRRECTNLIHFCFDRHCRALNYKSIK